MSNMTSVMSKWSSMIWDEWYIDISPEQRPWLLNKIVYKAMQAAGRSFIRYLDSPFGRENELSCAIAYRRFAMDFDTSEANINWDDIVASLCDNLLGTKDETALPERPDWISEEEWEEAKQAAQHDADGKLIRPQLEGFLTNCKLDEPCVYPTEFDEDNGRKVVRSCMQAVLTKCVDSKRYTTQRLTKPNTGHWKAFWINKNYEAVGNYEATKAFIDQHELHWDEEQ